MYGHNFGGLKNMASLSFQHVYKKYEGGVVAVSDFNLDVADK
jgi:multiple sugar transport system ATP-binding protein